MLPYKELERFSRYKLYLIKKILQKINGKVVLSDYLNQSKSLKEMLQNANIIANSFNSSSI